MNTRYTAQIHLQYRLASYLLLNLSLEYYLFDISDRILRLVCVMLLSAFRGNHDGLFEEIKVQLSTSFFQ